MFSACCPDAARRAPGRARAATSSVFRSRKVSGSQLVRATARGRACPRSEAWVIGPAAEPGDDRVDRACRQPGQRHPHVRPTRSRRYPTASAFSSTTTRCAPASAARTASSGERPERGDAERPDRHAPVAQLVDGVLDGAEHRAERDDDRLARPSVRYGRDQPAGVRGRTRAANSSAICGDQRPAPHLPGVRQVAHLGERLGPDHRADRDRLGRVEHLARLVRRQERVDLLLGRAASTPLDRRA